MKIKVFLDSPFFYPLNYTIPDDYPVDDGTTLTVYLGNQLKIGWAFQENSTLLKDFNFITPDDYSGEIKPVTGIIKNANYFSPNFLRFILQSSRNLLYPPGQLFSLSLPLKTKNCTNLRLLIDDQLVPNKKINQPKNNKHPVFYFFAEEVAIPFLQADLNHSSRFTEIYLRSSRRIDEYSEILKQMHDEGRHLLLLTSDKIAATFIKNQLPDCLLYDSTTNRRTFFQTLQSKRSVIICGTILAALLPLERIGAIILDNFPASYYQLFNLQKIFLPLIARIRAEVFNIPLYYGSYQPPLTAILKKQIEFKPSPLDERTEFNLVHLTRNPTTNFNKIVTPVKIGIENGARILMIVADRKKDAELFCPDCQKFFRCPKCGRNLLVSRNRIYCTECIYESNSNWTCPKCKTVLKEAPLISAHNIQTYLTEIAQLDTNKICNLYQFKKKPPSLDQICSARIIISGLQFAMLNSPDLKADQIYFLQPESFFSFNNFFSAEFIFYYLQELLAAHIRNQENYSRKIYIFSHFAFHYALKLQTNPEQFFQREEKYRKWLGLPPFGTHLRLLYENRQRRQLGVITRQILQELKKFKLKKIYLQNNPQHSNFQAIIEIQLNQNELYELNLNRLKPKVANLIAL